MSASAIVHQLNMDDPSSGRMACCGLHFDQLPVGALVSMGAEPITCALFEPGQNNAEAIICEQGGVLVLTPAALVEVARASAPYGWYPVPAPAHPRGTYHLAQQPPELPAGAPLSITCPRCRRSTAHPVDVVYGWCANCADGTSPPLI